MVNGFIKDAGPSYDPEKAFVAYRSVYKGVIRLGMEIGVPGWDPNPQNPLLLTLSQVGKNMSFIKSQTKAGWFAWEYFKEGNPNFKQVRDTCRAILAPNHQPPNPTTSTPPTASTIKCPNCNQTLQVRLSK